ncbi:TVP38/TMEM64 family protein [Roseivirga sp. BDSF3-8]|uniref:TVP38/TMEM64 family protein n=1 Tax=Roseivirga sp. BDSF3-8 TaxID=3241598 RepID=UPI00353203AD
MSKRLIQLVFVLLVVLAILIFFQYDLNQYFSEENIITVKERLRSFGYYTPLIIIFLYIVFNVAGLPTFFFTLLSGYLYGVAYGLPLAWLGMTIGLCASFLCSRFLFRGDFISRFGGLGMVKKLEFYVEKYHMWSVLIFRVISVFPYNVMNYAYGLTSISFRDYVIGSAIGLIPVTAIIVWLGHLAASGQEASITTEQWVGFMAAVLTFIILGVILKKRFKQMA